MQFLKQLNPLKLLTVMAQIDQESRETGLLYPDKKLIVVLCSVAFCLLFVNYAKYNTFFFGFIALLSEWIYGNESALWRELSQHKLAPIYGLSWWAFIHVLGYFLIPCILIKAVFKESLAQNGLQIGSVKSHWHWYVLLAAPIVCFAAIVSFREDFATHYPFYSQAHRSWVDFLLWESVYIIQFIVLEFFFRGYMLQSTKHAFGSSAVLVMCLPYLMIHFPKPWLEATGAIFFGLFLGLLAMRSKSIWGGVGVHVTIALSMDVFALLQTNGLPSKFFP